eukprot:7144811-Prymnesium_polylepis.1
MCSHSTARTSLLFLHSHRDIPITRDYGAQHGPRAAAIGPPPARSLLGHTASTPQGVLPRIEALAFTKRRLVDARVNEAHQIEACVGEGEPGRVRTAINRT